MRVREKKGAGEAGGEYVFDGRGRASGHEMKSPGAGQSPSGPSCSAIHADGRLPSVAQRLSTHPAPQHAHVIQSGGRFGLGRALPRAGTRKLPFSPPAPADRPRSRRRRPLACPRLPRQKRAPAPPSVPPLSRKDAALRRRSRAHPTEKRPAHLPNWTSGDVAERTAFN